MEELKKVEASSDTLTGTIQKWLERTPGLEKEGFDFITKYKSSVDKILQEKEEAIS
ncbi:Tryptophan 2_3-dioxygenase, partial [Caligus rogercresseyi]